MHENNFTRSDNRSFDQLRKITIERNFTMHAEGSVLICFGNTKVICTASLQRNMVPKFLKGSNQGWITAEYGMLPRSTNSRVEREATKGKQSGRTQEIQRLIGRALRACIDLKKLGENTIMIDCDVLQADGGTRTAAITGSCIAMIDAINFMLTNKVITSNPLIKRVAAVSVGIYQDQPILDLNYVEDSNAEMDMNLIMDEFGELIEIQGTAESNKSIPLPMLPKLIALAEKGTKELSALQQEMIKDYNL